MRDERPPDMYLFPNGPTYDHKEKYCYHPHKLPRVLWYHSRQSFVWKSEVNSCAWDVFLSRPEVAHVCFLCDVARLLSLLQYHPGQPKWLWLAFLDHGLQNYRPWLTGKYKPENTIAFLCKSLCEELAPNCESYIHSFGSLLSP